MSKSKVTEWVSHLLSCSGQLKMYKNKTTSCDLQGWGFLHPSNNSARSSQASACRKQNWERTTTANLWLTLHRPLVSIWRRSAWKIARLHFALFSITPMLITCISNQCSHVNAPMWLFSLFSVQCQNCPKWVLEPAERNLCLQMLKINGNGIQHLLMLLVVKWKIQLRSPWLFFPHNKSSRCNLISVMIVRLKTTKCIDKWTIPMWGRKKIRARGFFLGKDV